MSTTRFSTTALALAALASVGACNERPLAYGDANSIIVVMQPDRWELVQETVYDALEPTIMTVRAEKTFTVTYQEPYGQFWDRLRRFRQMLVVGTRSDPWVQEVLEEAREPITDNGLHQVYDVWSSGQTVSLLLLDEDWSPDEIGPHLARVNELLDGQYRAYARNRMYISGVDSALADTLALRAGFVMWLPEVYRWAAQDSVYIFRNDNPDPSELIRQIGVTWLTPAVDEMSRDEVIAWRQRLTEQHYSEPQQVVLEGLSERTFDAAAGSVHEIQAQWRNPPERSWPAGGPFMTRTVTCDGQDRTYLLDAWLYAPGKEKYEYMIQLETLLDSFRCGS